MEIEETINEINENKINLFPESEMLTCIDCPYIPSIKINTNQHSINVECQNDIKIISENNNISGHFHKKILLEDYLSKLKNNYENNKKNCSLCNKYINTNNIYYCSFCKAFICLKCHNNIHIKTKDHPILKLDLININCNIHNKINKYYCKNCFKNICEYCLKLSKLHKNHEIINLNDILINDNTIKEIEEEIENEEKNVKIMNKKFKEYMNFVQKKYDDYIKLRKDEIELKKNILYTYNKYNNNYNSIMNVKKLKFDYFKFNENKEKEKEIDKEENKNKKNLNKLRNFKKLINELILYEESQCLQQDKEEINNQIDINNNNLNKELNKEKEKEKDKVYCYKENFLLKNSKFEVVNKITKKNVEAEFIISLKNNKLLIACNNRKIVIYEKNKLNNIIEKLCSVSLSISKKNAIRTIKNFKGIYQLKNENLLISMTGLSNFILSVDYKTKTFNVVQEFNISKTLRLNNPLFSNLPEDSNNYDDVIPLVNNNMNKRNIINHANNNNQIIYRNNINNNQINNNTEVNNNGNNNIDDINTNLNINELIVQGNKNLPHVIRRISAINRNNANNIINNNNNLNNNSNNNQNPINNININNNIQRNIPHIGLIPHGIVQRINNGIGIPVNHPLPINIVNRVNNRYIRRRNLATIIALPNDDLLALSSKESWVLRKNTIKYVIYKDGIINCSNILMIKKALPISENEFVVEMTIFKKKATPLHHHYIVPKVSRKNNLLYIFFNLNYEEICRKDLNLDETYIISDNEYIYINDLHTFILMNKKNKEVINIIEINSIGPIFPNKLNKSFIIQEKENNAIVEYRIINNEVIRGEQLLGNEKVKLLAGLDDDFNTLVIYFRNECLLFLQ